MFSTFPFWVTELRAATAYCFHVAIAAAAVRVVAVF